MTFKPWHSVTGKRCRLAARREAQEARGDKAWTPKIVNVRSPSPCALRQPGNQRRQRRGAR
ncbi:hypothetical protein ACNKHP_13590 [Shigella boydii]